MRHEVEHFESSTAPESNDPTRFRTEPRADDREVIRRGLDAQPDNLELLDRLAELEREMGDLREASDLYLLLAMQAKLDGFASLVGPALAKALACDPMHVEAIMAQCHEDFEAGQADVAEQRCRSLIVRLMAAWRWTDACGLSAWSARFADDPVDFRLYEARCRFALGEREEAWAAVTKALPYLGADAGEAAASFVRRMRELLPDAGEVVQWTGARLTAGGASA